MTVGSVEPMKKLFARWGDRVRFVDVIVRQAHPGPGAPVYRSFAEKQQDAERYRRDEAIPWTVLVDDLEGTVHQVYGGLADPTYLIGIDGRVAYYNMWSYMPSLHSAIADLLEQGGRGIVRGGVNRLPHMTPALTTGWRGLRRGLPQSYKEMELAAPGSGTGVWLGYQLRSILTPLTQRAKPLPAMLKLGLALGAAVLAVLGVRTLVSRQREGEPRA